MTRPGFSLAALLAQAFVTSRLTAAFMLACLLIGSFALLQTPREDNPRIEVPAAGVMVTLPGAAPEEVEALLLRPLEAAIKQMPGVDDVYAVANSSVAIISVQFRVGEDGERALVRLQDRVNGARSSLPADASVPIVRSVSVDDVPIVTLTLASEIYDDHALKQLAERMADGLRSLDKVAAVYVKGGRDRELRIELDPDRLQAFAITLEQLRAQLRAANVAAPVGQLPLAGQNTDIHLDGFLRDKAELQALVIGQHQGRVITLADVASITDAPTPERDKLSFFAYGPAAEENRKNTAAQEMPAVTIAVAKQAGSNAVFVADDVLARVEKMRSAFVPAEVQLVVTRNDGRIANATVNGLIEHLLIAVLAVFLVTALFLGGREALIVGLAVPLVLALTLAVAYCFGQSINRVSLFALILSLGLLVDDAIVVIENIHRHYSLPGTVNKREATILAAREIGNPTNLATLAVMLVFGSLVVVTGTPGEYFFPVAFTVPVAMAASLLVAYTVVPWAAHRWLPVHAADTAHDDDAIKTSRLYSGYRRFLAPLIDERSRRRRAFLLVGILLLASLLMPGWQFLRTDGVNQPQSWLGVEVSMMPKDNKNTFNISIDMPEYATVEETDQLSRDIARLLAAHPQVHDYQRWLGQSGVTDFNSMLRGTAAKQGAYVAEIRVNLRDKAERPQSSMEIVRTLRPAVMAVAAKYPGSTVQLVEDPPGPPVRATLLAEIYGQDSAVLREISTQLQAVFRSTRDVVEVSDSEPEDVQRQRLVVDREKAALSGVSTAEVAEALRQLVAGEYLGRLHVSGERRPVDIRLLVPRRYQVDVDKLTRAFVSTQDGRRVPLSELVRVESTTVDRPIQHKNGERVSFVGGETGITAPVYAVLDMDKRLDGMTLPDGSRLSTRGLGIHVPAPEVIAGYELFWDGAQRQMMDVYRDMGGALIISLVLIFLMLVAYYQSFSLPVIAMMAIPLGLVGVFPGHWLMGQQFSATSMVGVIALAGVVVRNSLLIIDFVLEYRAQGRPLREAILEAGALRLRPILLTALAIILGSAIMLADPLFSGLAISLIFGTLAATVLTLIVIPVLLYLLLRWKDGRAKDGWPMQTN